MQLRHECDESESVFLKADLPLQPQRESPRLATQKRRLIEPLQRERARLMRSHVRVAQGPESLEARGVGSRLLIRARTVPVRRAPCGASQPRQSHSRPGPVLHVSPYSAFSFRSAPNRRDSKPERAVRSHPFQTVITRPRAIAGSQSQYDIRQSPTKISALLSYFDASRGFSWRPRVYACSDTLLSALSRVSPHCFQSSTS